MHRPTVGILALVLLTAGAASHYWGFGGEALAGACLRVGLVLAMLWLALPQARQVKSKLALGLIIAVLLMATFRARLLPALFKLAPIFVAAFMLLSLLRPRTPASQTRRERPRG
jgi:hypothetical protein